MNPRDGADPKTGGARLGADGQRSNERQRDGAEASITGFIFLEKGNHVAVLGWWNGTRDVLIERADGSRVVRPFRGLRKPLPQDPYRAALEAELRADLLRAEAGVPPARRFAVEDGEGVVRSGSRWSAPWHGWGPRSQPQRRRCRRGETRKRH
jgi:acetyl esterase